jgi:hypothetical protein
VRRETVRRAEPHGFCLHAHRDLGIAVSGVEADATEPTADDIDVNTSFEKINGGGMSPDMRRDLSLPTAASGLNIGGQMANTLVDPEACQWTPGTG